MEEHYQYKIIDLVERGVVKHLTEKGGWRNRKEFYKNQYELDNKKLIALLAEEDRDYWQPVSPLEFCSFFMNICTQAGARLQTNSGTPKTMLFRRKIHGPGYR